MLLDSLFGKKNNSQMSYAKMLDGSWPIFSQFGKDIYMSDVVQNCIACIADEIAKLQPRHIRTDPSGMQSTPNSSINRLLKFAPNKIMSTSDMLQKIIWTLYKNYNAFIYPAYNLVPNNRGGYSKEYTGIYPLDPINVTFLQDEADQLFIKMDFAGGSNFTLLYDDVIHLRKKFGENSIMGGSSNGRPDNAALLKTLSTNDQITAGLGKAIQSSMSIRGVLKINTMLDDEKQAAERKRFESAINDSKSGLLVQDLKGEYTPLNTDPKVIDADTMAFIQSKILNWYGVSLPILNADFTDVQYEAFQEKTLNPVVVGLNQGFSRCIFTDNELAHGNEIQFFQQDLIFLSVQSKLNLIKTAGEMGILTDNQKLAILGMPPIEGGERRTMSLNYVDVTMANEYQMKRAGAAKIDTNIT
ncbi:phage portal protein [Pelosinus propionicus]|uniref:Phage portal protein, HK97 family n=1 Tax=Pelosinus propionicus DSM 13327 TaxID=1123291 RepID=A0A1I4N1J1_9FIRM|nr:phage portal protein [Pelosinus propionicus]SFM09245.1 phage portal protein, HK97 family [Pelosinus propionicus DSM 13327]